ncbi:proteasome subunit beta type-2-like isoform X2 [Bolinopsis microptera]|uniref:proteasome subunit beta type-2-like isoform X1 n=1 Tax=Bolinopsis microptera TaxID=2820187 RepID=UPI003078BF95
MECLIGITGKDFVVVASDNLSAHSIIAIKHDAQKQFELGDKMIMAVSGDAGDMTNYAEYIQKNLKLYEMVHGYKLTPNAAANFSRKVMAQALRSRGPYMVNLLLAGVEDDGTPSLYFMDYLAAMTKEKFAAHGYGSFFILSTLDRYYREDMTKDQAVDLLKTCIREVQSRFIVNLNAFSVKIIDKDGIKELGDIPNSGTVHKDVPKEAIHPELIARA